MLLAIEAEGKGNGEVEDDGEEGNVGLVAVAGDGVLAAEFLHFREVGFCYVGICESCAALYYIYVARTSEVGVFYFEVEPARELVLGEVFARLGSSGRDGNAKESVEGDKVLLLGKADKA